MSIIGYFREECEAHLRKECPAGVCRFVHVEPATKAAAGEGGNRT